MNGLNGLIPMVVEKTGSGRFSSPPAKKASAMRFCTRAS